MRSEWIYEIINFLKNDPKIWKISALCTVKLSGQKSFKFSDHFSEIDGFINSFWLNLTFHRLPWDFLQEILQTTSVETLAFEVRNVFKSTKSSSMANIILEAAELGHLGVYQLVTEKCVNKNPPSLFTTPLHKAAGRGHLSICQFIIENTR